MYPAAAIVLGTEWSTNECRETKCDGGKGKKETRKDDMLSPMVLSIREIDLRGRRARYVGQGQPLSPNCLSLPLRMLS